MTGGERRLAVPVNVGGVDYAAGDVPEPQHAVKITNPKAWADDPQDDTDDTADLGDRPTPLVVNDASAPKVARPSDKDSDDTDRRKTTRRTQ